jgi:hypothetical protein
VTRSPNFIGDVRPAVVYLLNLFAHRLAQGE